MKVCTRFVPQFIDIHDPDMHYRKVYLIEMTVKRIEKSKKPYICDTCGSGIPTGSSYWNKTDRTYGKPGIRSIDHFCIRCGVPIDFYNYAVSLS